ncbi:MAG: carbohydrate kinase family protein [Anaerolineaceae bacterium]|nr:carbohydrate kinase family protein [Anaerolineaceae bacterium]
MIRYLIAGRLQRDFILTKDGKPHNDIPGGSLLHAATGFSIWDSNCGLIGRIGEDFPQHWLESLSKANMDIRGIRILPENIDLRTFISHFEIPEIVSENPLSYFSHIGMKFPKSLLGYTRESLPFQYNDFPIKYTIHQSDIPSDYTEATSAHLCPMDFNSYAILIPALKSGNIQTISLEIPEELFDPIFDETLKPLIRDITIFITSERKIKKYFRGYHMDIWEMAEAIAKNGCEAVIIKSGQSGQYIFDTNGNKRWLLPIYPVNIYDETGAGDAFAGGFMAGYKLSYDPLEAALYGNISASFSLEGTSPFYLIDTLPGLPQARLDNLRGMVKRI